MVQVVAQSQGSSVELFGNRLRSGIIRHIEVFSREVLTHTDKRQQHAPQTFSPNAHTLADLEARDTAAQALHSANYLEGKNRQSKVWPLHQW